MLVFEIAIGVFIGGVALYWLWRHQVNKEAIANSALRGRQMEFSIIADLQVLVDARLLEIEQIALGQLEASIAEGKLPIQPTAETGEFTDAIRLALDQATLEGCVAGWETSIPDLWISVNEYLGMSTGSESLSESLNLAASYLAGEQTTLILNLYSLYRPLGVDAAVERCVAFRSRVESTVNDALSKWSARNREASWALLLAARGLDSPS